VRGTLVVAAFGLLLAQEQAPFYTDKKDLLTYLDSRLVPQPVRSISDWNIRRSHILQNMEKVMGSLPDPSSLGLDVESGPTEDLPDFRRRPITFVSEAPAPGGKPDRVPAFLLLPKEIKAGARAPAVLCLHQTTRIGKGEPAGVGGKPDLHYAAELARRGFVTFAPDYPNFGDYTFDPYANGYVSATMKAIVNHRRAIDVLRSLPEVDPDRIGVIGHSLGGHNSLFLAAFDPRVKAVVTSCGFNSFAKYKGGDLTGWSHKGYMPRIAEVYAKDPARMPFDFTEVLAALAPRPVFINAPLGDSNFEVSGVKDCEAAAGQIYDKVFQARDRLVAVYPEAGHEFPVAIRQQAYGFLERWLR
jgi:dienelactone hydrolase